MVKKNYNRIDLQLIEGHPPKLLVDGKPADETQAEVDHIFTLIEDSNHLPPDGNWVAHILDADFVREISAYRFADIGASLGALSFPFRTTWDGFIERIYLIRRHDGAVTGLSLALSLKIWPDQWANPFTIGEYQDALLQVAENNGEFEHVDLSGLAPWEEDYDKDGIERDGTLWELAFASAVRSADYSIGEETLYWSEKFRTLSAVATRGILKNRKDALVTFFEFPDPLKTTCEQYLIYFIQFLEDLGIRADSEIKQEAGHVMFSIIPKDGASALVKIKEALTIYLSFPTASDFNEAANQFSDVAVTQLKANVFFLQSQMELAKAVIQAKDAAINLLDLTVFQQRQLLAATAEGASAHPPQAKTHEEEPLLGNTVYVTSYEGKGFKINLPHILRRLKRVFGVPLESTNIDKGYP
jgi:hypothetical protein